MTKENIKHSEEEKKKKKLSEKEIQEEYEKQLIFVKRKEEIRINIETDEELGKLKVLIERGVITETQARRIIGKEILNTQEINELFGKIKEIEDIKNITRYLPINLVISSEEYKKALTDKKTRDLVLDKCNQALKIIANKVNGQGLTSMSLFSGFLHILDRNLTTIQENTIDIRSSLEKINKK